MRLARGWRQTGQAAGTVLQLGVPEPGERRRRAQVSETDRVPDREASLVRSALPAHGNRLLNIPQGGGQ